MGKACIFAQAMKPVEFYQFMLPPSPWSKKPYLSRWTMTIEYAAEHYPKATPVLSTKEVRMCPEDNAEAMSIQLSGRMGHRPGD